MKQTLLILLSITMLSCAPAPNQNRTTLTWPENLPVYDHILIVVEENKDYREVIGQSYAPYINQLKQEGANFTRAFGEEHFSQGNYFWLFSGSDHNIGFDDIVPVFPIDASNLGYQLIKKGLSFKGYSESLPAIGSTVTKQGVYARKHVPWISFSNLPNGTTISTSSNLRFEDFPSPADYKNLPTVCFVIPDLDNDMHNCYPPNCPEDNDNPCCIQKGDTWLQENIDSYYQWAKNNNSLLILTFDENDDVRSYQGLTNPSVNPDDCKKRGWDHEYCVDLQNRIVTIFAGAHIRPGDYPEGKGITHVNILRTIEAMYRLPKSGAQQPNAAGMGISDDYIITDVFEQAASKN